MSFPFSRRVSVDVGNSAISPERRLSSRHTLRRRRSAGFTLAELMVIVVIVGTLGAVAMYSMAGASNGQSSGSVARAIQFAMMRARQESAADGFQRQISCTSKKCTYDMAQTIGMGSPAFTTIEGVVQANSNTTIWNFTATIDDAANNAGGTQWAGTQTVTFYPDGTAAVGGTAGTGGTIYVRQINGNAQYKIYVFPATGLARLVANW